MVTPLSNGGLSIIQNNY